METGFLNKNIKIIINYLLGPLLFLILCWALYRQIMKQEDLPQRWNDIREGWKHPLLWLAFLLLFFNWGIESLKWKILLSHLERISFSKAFRSVLAGISVIMLTPNRIGEYAGRILYVSEGNRIKSISLNVLGSISQLLITLIMGCIGLIIFRMNPPAPVSGLNVWIHILGNIVLYSGLLLALLLSLLYFRIGRFVHLLAGIPFLKSFVKHISVLDSFSRKQLLTILFLSFLRYLIFILQYMMLLKVFGAGIPWMISFWLLAVFYLLMTAVPSIGLSELPLRASASVEIFRIFTSNAVAVQASAFSIWIINLAPPALVGSLLILGIRIMKEK